MADEYTASCRYEFGLTKPNERIMNIAVDLEAQRGEAQRAIKYPFAISVIERIQICAAVGTFFYLVVS